MLSGYCAGWSLRTLLHEGLNGVPGKVEAAPPRHCRVAVGQIVNFLGTLQNEWAGAQAFSSFDTYMAPFVRKDDLTLRAGRQCIQELIYNLNVPSRWGTQTPFTNLTFDWICPDDLRDQVPLIGGEEMPLHLRRPAGRDGPDQPRLHRGHDRRATPRAACSRSRSRPTTSRADFDWDSANADRAVRDDRQVRPAVLPELPQFRAEART